MYQKAQVIERLTLKDIKLRLHIYSKNSNTHANQSVCLANILPCNLAMQKKMRVSVTKLRRDNNELCSLKIARTLDLNIYLGDNAYIWVTEISGFLNAKAMPSA